MIKHRRVSVCIAEHRDCVCRDAYIRSLEHSLMIIRTWANNDTEYRQDRAKAMQDIVDIADKALEMKCQVKG